MSTAAARSFAESEAFSFPSPAAAALKVVLFLAVLTAVVVGLPLLALYVASNFIG